MINPEENTIVNDTNQEIERNEEQRVIQIINGAVKIYFESGARSNKKVNYFHSEIQKLLQTNYFHKEDGYSIELEYNIESINSAGKKKCDIVILKHGKPYIIIPVKIIMTNFKQNKNNYWESLTGELTHIKWKNPNIIIIPINVLMNKTPYLDRYKKISNFEDVGINDIQIYSELITRKLCSDVINYIVEVEHIKKKDEYFDKIMSINKFITPYRSFDLIFKSLV